MKVSSAAVKQQAGNIAKLSASAARALKNAVPNAEDIPALMREVTGAYSLMSAAVTANYYTSIRRASRVRSKFTPAPFTAYDAGKVTAATLSILDEVAAGTATVPLESLLADVVSRYIKDSADTCIRQNVRRDPAKPKYAIVPSGDACAFCQMRASLGYHYGTEEAVKSHDHCTCTPTPVFGNSTIEGYNPKEYEAKYNEAAKAYRTGNISEDMSLRIEQAHKAHDKRYAEGETDKKWEEMNAILMVMREQQGIK